MCLTKIDIIYNWADEASLKAPNGHLPSDFPGPNQFRIVFAGNMGKAQALDAVLNAASLLQGRGSRVCFVMLGGGVEVNRLKQQAKDMNLNNVVFLPPVPMSEVGTTLNAADALLVHLRKDPLFKITIPSKSQAYMAMGKPLLMAVEGDAADLVIRSGGGVVAESENAEAIADAADALAVLSEDKKVELGKKTLAFYQEHLALRIGVAKFGTIFKCLDTDITKKAVNQ